LLVLALLFDSWKVDLEGCCGERRRKSYRGRRRVILAASPSLTSNRRVREKGRTQEEGTRFLTTDKSPLLAYTTRKRMPDLTSQPYAIHSHSPALSHSSRALPTASSVPTPDLVDNPRQVRWGSNEVYSQSQTNDGGVKEAASEEDEDEEDEGRSILAISAMKSKLGCCYYDAGTQKLHFNEDQSDSGSWDLTNLSAPLAFPFSPASFLSTRLSRSTNHGKPF
jgi:hypothetical protein